ncbi:B-cell antigen receptor complex-associated protein alpha chain isoform X2 [Phyllobates terribilis]|uniref:B-cell antigen receptor complex-associated protein alpha chain isoform X2 n=1 Tax=Phyllobates terribilis TaxID=111132 RepID=UPI003CCB1778
MPLNSVHVTWTTPKVMFFILLSVPCWGLEMRWVPTSISIFIGEDIKIPCNYNKEKDENVSVSWVHIYTLVRKINDTSFLETIKKNLPSTTQTLDIYNAKRNDRGMYVCHVTVGSRTDKSCGTYLRVRESPVYLFFNIAEATKNRLITAEGIILLLCAIIPGTFLLYKRCHQAEAHKRLWEAYSTAGRASSNDYSSLTAVELLTIQGAYKAM